MPEKKVYIIGIGPGGLSSLAPETCRIINNAEVLFGGKRLLDIMPDVAAEKIIIKNNLPGITSKIEANIRKKSMVVLASGDPNFYGIAGYLTKRLGKDTFEIIPNVSSMQLAFAKVKENWDDAVFASVHSRPMEAIVELVRTNNKVGIFTDDRHNPTVVASFLLEQGIADCRAYVCQNLGRDDEQITETNLKSLCAQSYSPLNILILLRDTSRKETSGFRQSFGIADDEFSYRKPEAGLITKLEIRAVS